jgi:hypothetical protein
MLCVTAKLIAKDVPQIARPSTFFDTKCFLNVGGDRAKIGARVSAVIFRAYESPPKASMSRQQTPAAFHTDEFAKA